MTALIGYANPGDYADPLTPPSLEGLEPSQLRRVLDFGCGCGRVARRLIQRSHRPERYVGLDLHAGMIAWCNQNLAPAARGFEFLHHDVRYEGFNPGQNKPLYTELPFADGEFSLVIAVSVFTHLTQVQSEAYLRELSRVLAPGGILLTSWFLFDKRDFPMMQVDQNTLFINELDVRNAVIYDRQWLREAAADVGLVIRDAISPPVRGHQWELRMAAPGPGLRELELPDDLAPHGRRPPPPMPLNADRIGHRRPESRR